MAPFHHRKSAEMPRLTRADLELPPAVRARLPPRGTSIMKLSHEIHFKIVEMLELPENVCLKYTSQYFYQLVKPMDIDQLWKAELSNPYFRYRVMGCSGCLRLRRRLEFFGTQFLESLLPSSHCHLGPQQAVRAINILLSQRILRSFILPVKIDAYFKCV